MACEEVGSHVAAIDERAGEDDVDVFVDQVLVGLLDGGTVD